MLNERQIKTEALVFMVRHAPDLVILGQEEPDLLRIGREIVKLCYALRASDNLTSLLITVFMVGYIYGREETEQYGS